MNKIAAIIMAAGRGKRMNSRKINKVVLPLGGKQVIVHVIDRLTGLSINPIIVVVGFAKDSVVKVLGSKVFFAEQRKRLGTANAVFCALKKLPENITDVLVLQGDDSAFFSEETISNLINVHLASKAAFTFLTIEIDNPFGLGRVIRDNGGKVIGIVEEKDATDLQRAINEINPACYVFQVSFLRRYLKQIKKSSVTGEYYLTSLIDIAIKNKEKIEAVAAGKILWRGINTPEELKEAEKLLLVNRN